MPAAEPDPALETLPGDDEELAPDTVDHTYGNLPEAERERIREALVAAAVPHWCDAGLVAALLNCPPEESAALLERLQGLRVVAPCPERGEGSVQVQAGSRRVLRAWLRDEDVERWRSLSARAHAYFISQGGDAARVEAVYHRFTTEPEEAARDAGRLYDDWHHGAHFEPLLMLAATLEELEEAGLPGGLVRGRALDVSGCIRQNYRRLDEPLEPLAERARAALAEFEVHGDERLILVAQSQLGNILFELGDLDGALAAYTAYRDLAERQVAAKPEDKQAQRSLSLAHNKVGDVLLAGGDLAGALAAFHAALTIAVSLVQRDPAHLHLQRDLAVTHERIGDVLHAQQSHREALAALAASRDIRLSLLEREPTHLGWLDDLATSHNRIALAFHAQRDLPGALAAHRAALAILERTAALAPDQSHWQIELAGACANVADTLRQLHAVTAGTPDPHTEARELLDRARGILDALAATHPPAPEEERLRSFVEELAVQLGD